MAIIRRTKIQPVAAAPVIIPDDADEDIVIGEEGSIDFESLNTDLPDEIVHLLRLGAFADGNNGQQPHPKQEPLEKLLSMVQDVQNVDDPQFARMEGFYRNRIKSPLTGIRAFCVLCMGGAKAANSCTSTGCPLWGFRTGKNSFFGKNK